MEIVTVFLIVLVIALVIGNLLLSFIGRGPSAVTQPITRGSVATLPAKDSSTEVTVLKSRIKAATQKVNMAHGRLDALESFLLSKGSPIFPENLKEKLMKLDNSRANTEVELIAIKEILAELQNKGIVAKAKKFKKERKPKKELSDKKMHKIIYRSKQK